MYFDEPAEATPVEGPREMRTLLSANGLALLALGILPAAADADLLRGDPRTVRR